MSPSLSFKNGLAWAARWVWLGLGLLYGYELTLEMRAQAWPWGNTLFHGAWAALIGLAGWLVIETLTTRVWPAWMWRVVYWTPRLAALLFATLISLMALDVFGEGANFWNTALAFLLHLAPGALLFVGCALAWRWEWIGAVAFIGWGLWYLTVARGFVPSVYVEVAGLPLVLGLLFWLNWHYRAERPIPPKVAA